MGAATDTFADETALGELDARLRSGGAGGLDDIEVLRLACRASEAAVVKLMGEFGSLPQVLAASRADLERCAAPAIAGRLVVARDLARRMLAAPLREGAAMSSWPRVADYLRAVLGGRSRQQFRVLFLDRRNRLIRDEPMGEGTIDHAPAYPREVLRRALELNASAVLLATCHPDGNQALTSSEIELTRQVLAAARPLRIGVHDHAVVAGEAVVSFRALGLL